MPMTIADSVIGGGGGGGGGSIPSRHRFESLILCPFFKNNRRTCVQLSNLPYFSL